MPQLPSEYADEYGYVAGAPAPRYTPALPSQISASPPIQSSAPAAVAAPSPARLTPDIATSYFTSKGLTPEQARGVATRLMQESGGNPTAYNSAGGGLGAYGIAQDRGIRQSKLVQMYGPTPTVQNQLDYAWYELNTSEKQALDKIKKAGTTQEAYNAFTESFERPGVSSNSGTGFDSRGLQLEAGRIGHELRQESRADLSTITNDMARYSRAAAQAPPGSQEMDAALQRQTELSEKAASTFDELAKHPPVYTPMDVMQRLGSLGTVIAVLGGLKSRQPMTAALGAAGKAMQAVNQNNYDDYKIAFDQWKAQSDAVVQSLRAHSEAINQILSNKRLSIEERNSELNAFAVATQNDFLKAKLAQGAIEAPYQLQVQLAEFSTKMQELQNQTAQINASISKNQAQEEHMKLQDDVLRQQLGTLGPGGTPAVASVPWPGMPQQPPPGISAGIWSDALVWAKTGKNPSLGFGQGPLRFQFEQAKPLAQMALGVDPEQQGQAWIDYQEQTRRQLAIANGFGPSSQAGKNLISLNTVADHLSLLQQYADALKNKDIPLENQVINRMSVQSGMPEVIQFALARTISADEVIRLLTTTGGTVEDRGGLQRLLSEYGSPEQLNAAINTASNFVRGRYEPLRQSYSLGDSNRQRFFDDNMMTPEARQLFAGPQKPVAGGDTKYVKGQTITGPDGKQYKVIGGDLNKDPDIEPVK